MATRKVEFDEAGAKTIREATPSGLIELALRDLAKIERASGEYSVDMGEWHRPSSNETCSVCLAGSVMAKTLAVDSRLNIEPSDVDGAAVHRRLYALDDIRVGSLGNFLRAFPMSARARAETADTVSEAFGSQPNPNYIQVPDYDWDADGFKAAMRKVVKALKSVGL